MIKEDIKRGDLVISLRGRDEGHECLVVEIENGFATVVDGKTRKTKKPKSKNLKHLKKIQSASLPDFAARIRNGEPVSDYKLRKAIDAETNKYRRNSLCQKTT